MRMVSLDCPYCGTAKSGFKGVAFAGIKEGLEGLMIGVCSICEEGVLIKFKGRDFVPWASGSYHVVPPVINYLPLPIPTTAPSGCPENIARFYEQGTRGLSRGDYDAAGVMFRRVLEASLKRLAPEATGSLYRRINALPPELGLTPAMKEWAHAIRDLGNDAAHEEEPIDERHAKALHGFTEVFLRYCFEMPARLEERRQATPPV